MCLCVCKCVCVLTNKRGLQIWRQPWLLLFALFIKRRWADGLLVCCVAHTCGPHTHTQTQIRTCMLNPVTLALSSIYLFHYTSLGRTMPLCELRGGARVCVCVWKRQKGYKAVWMKSQTEPLRWSSEKADDSLAHWLLWIIAIHSSAALYSARIACNGGIVFMLLICPCPGNKTRHIWTRSREGNLATSKDLFQTNKG